MHNSPIIDCSIARQVPVWCPQGLLAKMRADKKRRQRVFNFAAAERRILRKRPPIPVSVWAERHRILNLSVVPGPWRNTTAPQLVGIMDAAMEPCVRTVILCKSVQSGGTECVHNIIGHCIDRQPGPAMYLFPDKNTAQENAKDRIQPMIADSPRLRKFLTGTHDDVGQLRIRLKHMIIYLAWAHSPTSMANKPCRYVVQDETDKYPATASKTEADPSSLVEKRLTTYKRTGKSKNFKISTPSVETGVIWKALTKEAQVIFDYWVKCPDCGGWQLMRFDDIRVPEDERDPERIEAEKLAWYQCQKCPSRWDDNMRDLAVHAGQWRSRKRGLELFTYLRSYQPQKIGFHMPAWISYFVTLSECAAAFFRGQTDKNKLKDFMTQYKAEPWKPYEHARTEDILKELRDERPAGMVPAGGEVAALVAGVDTQDDGFWYEIRAIGWGQTRESWQVRAGFVDSFAALAEVLWKDQYLDADGNKYFVRLAVQDAMGHRTDEVYTFARSNPGRLVAFKGEQRMAQPFAFSQVDFFPGTKKAIPGGLKLLRADVNYFKNILSGKLGIAPADPGAWHFSSETTDAWLRMLTVEYIDEKTGLWVCDDGKANHGWDCSVYGLVAADVLGVRYWARPDAVAASQNAAENKKPAVNPYTGQAAGAYMKPAGR